MKKTSLVYTKSELASLYFPDARPESARRSFKRWIDKHTEMKQELIAAGYGNNDILLTPRQVRIIFKHLGAP